MAPKKLSPKTLTKKIEDKIRRGKFRVGIVGLGYVGLPLALEFAEKKIHVTGFDLDQAKVREINRGISYIDDISSRALKKIVRSGYLQATTDFSLMGEQDVIIVCVPTPLNRAKDPDISCILEATANIQKHLKPGQVISLESTTYPGTTEEVILPMLEDAGLRVGRDFFLCFSPERIDPGNKQFKTHEIPKVVGGISPACTKMGSLVYGSIFDQIVPVSSCRSAELAKLLENTFRIVNIGLINELAQAAGSLGIDIWEAVEAAKTKPFGFMPFYPGPGIGGHCIGVDPMYLSWKARQHGTELHFIELARRMNAGMPKYVVSRTVSILNEFARKAVSKSRVGLLGVTYKRDIADTRESPAFDILKELHEQGAEISYHDPFVANLEVNEITLRSQKMTRKYLQGLDLAILVTDHSQFSYANILKDSRMIFDTRNAFKKFKASNLIRL